jgi:RND family efflux transporter MFP subunit
MTQQGALYQKDDEIASRGRLRRRFLWAGLALVVLAGLGAYLLWGLPHGPATVVVRRGMIRGTVVASGEVVSEREVQISSRVAGQVSAVPVKAGDEVVSGTLLVTVEASTLDYQVREARLRVELAQLQLDQGRAGARPEELAAAQADLDMATAHLQALQNPRPQDVTVARQEVVQAEAALAQAQEATGVAVETARLNWETAANALRDAQDNYSRIYWENEHLRRMGIELSQAQKDAEASAWRRVQDAEAGMEQGRLAYEQAQQDQQAALATAQSRLAEARARLQALLAGPTAADLAQAQAQVDRARAALEELQAGPRPSEVRILEKDLELAQLSLEEALADLDKATVRAPFSGTVVTVAVEEGEMVGAGSALVQLADMQRLRVQARVDEIDVGQVSPGQPVTITLDAFPGRPLRGSVKEIAPAVALDLGTASYLATVALAGPLTATQAPSETSAPSLTLRLGMAANLTIVTVEKDSVLLLPRQAVERVGVGSYVTVLRGGRHERVRVTLGVADPQNFEVVEGLVEGDVVVLP